ncbi:hypothetical protein BKA62DRAFT_754384 [Auriculariales sp. MPI-PUGE-AT-0066]|nr:hypothetical protein BKA62DRAFT_754384 [Auriculariales sp. MPI-PUGE-AT-0066]
MKSAQTCSPLTLALSQWSLEHPDCPTPYDNNLSPTSILLSQWSPLLSSSPSSPHSLMAAQEDYLSVLLWLEAHPWIAAALLTEAEVFELATVAQDSMSDAQGIFIDAVRPFSRTVDLIKFKWFTLGIRVVGWVDMRSQRFLAQTFVLLRPPSAKPLETKGPKLEGVLSGHVGPVPISLPRVDEMHIWVKLINDHLEIIAKVTFFDTAFIKQFFVVL